MLLCKHCIEVLKEQSVNVVCDEGEIFIYEDEAEEMGLTCNLCDTIDNLYTCSISNNSFEPYNTIKELRER